MRLLLLPALFILLLLNWAHAAPRELWVYCPTNLQVDANLDKLAALFDRAQKAGYTHVLLADSKFTRLGDLGSSTQRYFANVERVKALATAHRLELVPAVFGVGYSNGHLWHNPNLAEGVKVVDTPLVVKGGKLVVDAEPMALAKPSWKDDNVALANGVATVENSTGNARFVYKLKLPPNRAFHVSVKVKTDDFSARPEIKPLAGNRVLSYSHLGTKRTQDWTEHHVVFTTPDAAGENTDVNLYFGVWGNAKGRLQWKDWKIEEAAFVNVLRRDGTPVTITDANGAPIEEGKQVDRIIDPLLGAKPWPGEYTVWHEPPVIKTKLAEGTRLRASWYYPPIIYDGQVGICPSEKQTLAILKDQFERVHRAFGASGYMMSHDEIRVWNQCAACRSRNLDAGAILADNAKACEAILAGKRAYVWSDMFDPFHNARADYYLVRGDFKNAWDGLSKNTVIMNWNHGKRDDSLKFFRERGHRQVIAAYYDQPSLASTKTWLESTASDDSVIGYMYTTWEQDYSQLEAFARLCR